MAQNVLMDERVFDVVLGLEGKRGLSEEAFGLNSWRDEDIFGDQLFYRVQIVWCVSSRCDLRA